MTRVRLLSLPSQFSASAAQWRDPTCFSFLLTRRSFLISLVLRPSWRSRRTNPQMAQNCRRWAFSWWLKCRSNLRDVGFQCSMPKGFCCYRFKTHIPRAQSKHLDPMLNLKSQPSFVFRLNWSCSTYHQFLGRSACEVLVSMGIPKWEWLICNVIIDCPWLSSCWRYCISYLRAYGWKNCSWCHVPLLQCRQHASPFCGQVALFLCDLSQEVCKLLHQSSKTGSKHRDAKYSTSSLSCRILCNIPIFIYIFIRYISLYSSHFFPFSHEVYYILSHAMATSLRECTSSYFFVPFQRPRPAAAATATAI